MQNLLKKHLNNGIKFHFHSKNVAKHPIREYHGDEIEVYLKISLFS